MREKKYERVGVGEVALVRAGDPDAAVPQPMVRFRRPERTERNQPLDWLSLAHSVGADTRPASRSRLFVRPSRSVVLVSRARNSHHLNKASIPRHTGEGRYLRQGWTPACAG